MITDEKAKLYQITKLAIFYLFLISIIFSATFLQAQGFKLYNPVESSQPWVSEVNPAILSSQYSRISLGLKVFHYGFLPDKSMALNESHINASFPFLLPVGIGFGLRFFSAGIYSELEGSVMMSKTIFRQFSIGAKVGVERIGFSRQDFSVVDANDPLLAGNLSKTAFNFGFGLYWNNDKWSMGFGMDHINKPDIGFQTSAILPQEIYAGIGYKSGNFMPALLFKKDDKWVSYGLAVSLIHERIGLIRFSFENTMPIKMEIQLNLSKNNSLQYGIDLPTKELSDVSVGSHQMTYNHILGRGPDIAQPKILISSDTMRIYEERVVRSMPGELTAEVMEKVDGLIPGYLDLDSQSQNVLIVPAGVLSENETKSITRQRYIGLSEVIERKLQRNPKLSVVLNSNERSLGDARILKHYLLKKGIIPSHNINISKLNSSGDLKLDGFVPGKIHVSQKKPIFSDRTLVITLQVPGKTRQVRDWSLKIYNNKKEVIKLFNGKDKLPDRLEWDWKDKWGEIVAPGRYVCLLSLRAASGQKKISASPAIDIKRLNRSILLRFSMDDQPERGKKLSSL